jgi:hypothetical protein
MLLRSAIIVTGGIIAIVGIMMLSLNFASDAGIACLVGGLVLVAGTVFEHIFYKEPTPGAPGGDWVRTDERFVDPQTGKTVTVYERPGSGERKYVSE